MARAVVRARATPRKPSTPRNQKRLRAPSPASRAKPREPAARAKPTGAQQTQAFAAAHDAARLKAWGVPGQVLTNVGPVEVWSAAPSGWHLVTRGLWRAGFELSLRVAKAKDDAAPPAWALALLERQVRRCLEPDAPAPDETWCVVEAAPLAPESELGALAFARDALGPITTPDAEVPVWQLVPITRDEERVVREWSPSGLVEILRAIEPQLVATIDRPSLLSSPRARLAIEQRIAREGSSLSAMRARVSSLGRAKGATTWKLSAEAVDTFIALLKGRTAHQRAFTVRGAGPPIEVRPGDCAAVELSDGGPVLKLSQAASRQLRAVLRPKPGKYTLEALPGFTLEVC